MKEHGRFQAGGLWMDGMQIPGVDEIKTLLLYVISLHIDIQLEVSFHKIQDFHLVMPVMFYSFPVCDLEDFIEAAGKRGCAVVLLLLQIHIRVVR